MNHHCATLTHNKTPEKWQGAFIDGMQKRSFECEAMLNYDGKLNISIKLGVVSCFTVLSAR